MDNNWSLNELYTSFESKEFIKDLHMFSDMVKLFKDYVITNFDSHDNPLENIENYINMQIDRGNLNEKLRIYCFLRISVNANDNEATAYMAKIGKISSQFTKSDVIFNNYIIGVRDIDTLINSSSLLKEHEFYLKEIIEQGKYQLSKEEEDIISKFRLTGSSSWSKLQGKVSSQAIVDINENGKHISIPITALSQLPHTDDKDIKIERFKAECEAYKKYADISAACLNNIKGEVITLAELKEFSSPLDMSLFNYRMNKKTLDALIESIEEYLPRLRKYYKVKAKLLNYKEGLPYFEIPTQVGTNKTKFTIPEAKEYVLNAYRNFSEEMYEFAKNAFDNNWIDFNPKKGKRSGAFCCGIHSIEECRVLTNFNGGLKDINTLAHELGHGFHGKQLNDESILNINYPMPLAETASTFCEEVLKTYLVEKISDEEKLSFLSFSLLSAVSVTVDILSRYYFEKEFFNIRKDHELSTEEINSIMLNAQKKSYGDGLDNNYLNPYMWLNKVHYYYAGRNFYNFPYAFGLLFSLGLHSIYQEKGKAFLDDYNNLLKCTGKMNIEDVCKQVGVDVNDKEFWKKSLDKICANIDEFERLSNM